jgi:hypothetical protein
VSSTRSHQRPAARTPRWRLRPVLALLVCVAACSPGASCLSALGGGGDGTDPIRPTPPEEHELHTFGRLFQRAVNANDRIALGAMMDCERMSERLLDGMPNPNPQTKAFGVSFCEGVLAPDSMLGVWHATLVQGGSFTFRGLATRDGVQVPRFRILHPGGGFNFVDAIVERDATGRVRASDIFALVSGEHITTAGRRMLLLAEDSQPALLDRMRGEQNLIVEHGRDLRRMNELIASARHAEAVALFHRLPEPLRKDKSVLLIRSQAAQALDDALYLEAIEDLRRLYPNDPATLVASLDLHTIREEYDEGMRVVGLLNQDYPDPILDLHTAYLARMADDLDTAEQSTERALAQEPDLYPARALSVHLAVDREDWPEAARRLEVLHEHFEGSRDDPQFAPYLDTPLEPHLHAP